MGDDQIKEIKEHQQQLMGKVLEFTSDLSELKTSQKNLTDFSKEREKNFNDKMSAINMNFNDKLTIAERNIKDVITTAVSGLADDMKDINAKVQKHEDILDRITRVQETQKVQMDSIQKTLDEFKEIQKQIHSQDSRLKALEDKQRSEAEEKREQIKGKWSFAVAIGGGVMSLLAVILSTVLPIIMK